MTKLKNPFFFGAKKQEFYSNLLIRADYKEHEHIMEHVKELYPNGCKVLDMGCGQGAFSKRLSDNGFDVTAVDIDPSDFKCHDSIKFHKLDFNNELEVTQFLDSFKNKFDLVLGIEVIEHVENPWAYVKMLKSLVKKNGFLIITTPNITSWVSRLFFLIKGKFHQFDEIDLPYGHIAPISIYHLSVIYRNLNLKNLIVKEGGTLPYFYFPNFKLRWITLNIVHLLFRPFINGQLNGWCVITSVEKID
jgi:2-polyprenyl-3-methyl-5-hydroxy-6-metoxy-1,4-benzoquinol methylase